MTYSQTMQTALSDKKRKRKPPHDEPAATLIGHANEQGTQSPMPDIVTDPETLPWGVSAPIAKKGKEIHNCKLALSQVLHARLRSLPRRHTTTTESISAAHVLKDEDHNTTDSDTEEPEDILGSFLPHLLPVLYPLSTVIPASTSSTHPRAMAISKSWSLPTQGRARSVPRRWQLGWSRRMR